MGRLTKRLTLLIFSNFNAQINLLIRHSISTFTIWFFSYGVKIKPVTFSVQEEGYRSMHKTQR